MTSRLLFRGFAVFGAVVLVAVLTLTAVAQTSPVRVVQGSDGNLYVVQGTNSWKLVPDPISDSDLAALAPNGEIDGTLPNDLLIVQAPSAPQAAAPAPAPPVQQPAPVAQPPAPAPAAAPTPVPARSAAVTSGPPKVTIVNPSENQNVSAKGGASFTITGTAFDPNGAPGAIAEVQVWIFGERNASGATNLGTATVGSDGNWSLTFQPTKFTSTHANIYVYARSKVTSLESVGSRGFNITG